MDVHVARMDIGTPMLGAMECFLGGGSVESLGINLQDTPDFASPGGGDFARAPICHAATPRVRKTLGIRMQPRQNSRITPY
jgi:hypothetical protein